MYIICDKSESLDFLINNGADILKYVSAREFTDFIDGKKANVEDDAEDKVVLHLDCDISELETLDNFVGNED